MRLGQVVLVRDPHQPGFGPRLPTNKRSESVDIFSCCLLSIVPWHHRLRLGSLEERLPWLAGNLPLSQQNRVAHRRVAGSYSEKPTIERRSLAITPLAPDPNRP
jgi:hypothetical protein